MATILNIVNKGVVDAVGTPALLDQCAEEASELSQASLKMARKLRNENPTPKSITDIRDDLIEEISDVLLSVDYVMHCCNISNEDLAQVITEKQVRWIDRLNETKKEEGEE